MTIHHAIAPSGCGCDARDVSKTLITIDQALAVIAAHATPADGTQAVALTEASGRILAQPVNSKCMAPPFDNAAMDGYAVMTSALTGRGPWLMPVVQRIQAGQGAPDPLRGVAAARILTGALIPDGADAVVMQEAVTRDGDHIRLDARPAAGSNIRRAGSDMATGARVLDAGCRLGPPEMAACAAAGAGAIRVHPRPRVALLVTGDEVRNAGAARSDAQIWDVNTPMLAAALTGAGLDLVATGHGADTPEGLTRQLADMAAHADLVVTTGGISVGDADHVKPALARLGAEMLLSGVAIKPGKPVSFGRLGDAAWLGLPGNPLSAFVTWQVFGTALAKAMTGETGGGPVRRHAITVRSLGRKPGRCEVRLATRVGFDAAGREVVTFDDAIHSGRVGGLPRADGLIFLPAEVEDLPAGALVDFQPLRQM